MKKIVYFSLASLLSLPVLAITAYAKTSMRIAVAESIYSKATRTSRSELITIPLLTEEKFQNIVANNLKGYQLQIASNYTFTSINELKKLLAEKKNPIQQLIDKTNKALSTPLSAKDLLIDKFPKAFNFRKPEQVNEKTDFTTWEQANTRMDGIFGKVLNEELSQLKTAYSQNFFNRYALNNPTKLVVLHFNGRGRNPDWEMDRFFAGHWMYAEGCKPTQNITEQDTEIAVPSTQYFETNYGLHEAKKNDDIVFVPLDDKGNKIWEDAEQVKLVAIENGKIKVLRGQYGTKARKFIAEKTYLAPHIVEGPWGPITNNLMWAYNYATTCPKDKNGKQCTDILLAEMTSWFRPDGILFAFNGIQFDVSPWDVKRAFFKRVADVNNDGKKDGGYINDRNVYGEGVLNFYTKLKQNLGTNKLVVADGGLDDSQRAVHTINGMEAEGFCSWNDVYKEFSKPVNFFRYWSKFGLEDQLSYITHKDKDASNFLEAKNRERMVIATAQCLGISFNTGAGTTIQGNSKTTELIDELQKGEEKIAHWLGKPIGKMIELGRTIQPITFALPQAKIESNDFSISTTSTNIRLKALQKDRSESTCTIKNVPLPKGDILLYFDAKTAQSIPGFTDDVPRHISIKLNGRNPEENTADRVLNYVNAKDFSACGFYFRNAGDVTCQIEITLEGNTDIELKNFKIVNYPQVLAREFENGLVLVNPSLNDFTFDLNELFPNKKFKRIKATINQKNENNTGEAVQDKVTVSKLNGLFLEKVN
ncbi:hypothetical protein [Pedobacter sp. MW01-1-1]|uniref:hypothetical protein n=1 Tax=Pedobacter sp. MW01-1-1 TaxID=3383027 RepID=UPI003FEF65E0